MPTYRTLSLALGAGLSLIACNDGSGGGSIAADNTDPLVVLESPQNGSVFDEGVEIVVRGTVSDREGRPSALSLKLILGNDEPVEIDDSEDPPGGS